MAFNDILVLTQFTQYVLIYCVLYKDHIKLGSVATDVSCKECSY